MELPYILLKYWVLSCYVIIILTVSVDNGITVFLCYSYIHLATYFNSNVQLLCLLVRKDIKIWRGLLVESAWYWFENSSQLKRNINSENIHLLPSVSPSIRVFSNESALCIRWTKYWSFSFSIRPSNEYSGLISLKINWFDLLVVQGIFRSLIQHHSLRASIFQFSAFMVHLSHPYMTTGKKLWLYRPLPFIYGGDTGYMYRRVVCNFLGRVNKDLRKNIVSKWL